MKVFPFLNPLRFTQRYHNVKVVFSPLRGAPSSNEFLFWDPYKELWAKRADPTRPDYIFTKLYISIFNEIIFICLPLTRRTNPKNCKWKKNTFRLSRELFLLLQHVRDVLEHKNWTFYPIDTLLNFFFYQNQFNRPLPSMTEHPYKLHENKTIQRLSRELLCCSNASGTSWSTKYAYFTL